MAVLDPTSAIGKVRLRVGDYFDLPIFPDTVYQVALDDNGGNVVRASKLMAQYILGTLTMRVHEKLMQVEVYGEQFTRNYIAFLKATVLNPNMMEIAPLPYAGSELEDTHPLIQFQKDWNANYASGTSSEQLSLTALGGSGNGLF